MHWDVLARDAREERLASHLAASSSPQIGWPDTCMRCGRVRGQPSAPLGPLGRRRADKIRQALNEVVEEMLEDASKAKAQEQEEEGDDGNFS